MNRSWWTTKRFWVGIGFTLFLGYVLLGSFVVPWWIQGQLVEYVDGSPGVALETKPTVSLNPFTFVVTVEEFAVQHEEEPLLGVKWVSVDLEPLSSLWYQSPVIDEINVNSPNVNVTRSEAGTVNWLDIIPEDPDSDNGVNFSITIHSLNIRNGRITWADRRLDPPVSMELRDTALTLRRVNPTSERPWPVKLTARIDGTGELVAEGRVHPTGNLAVELDLDRFPLESTNPYVGTYVRGQWDTGTVSLEATASGSEYSDLTITSDLSVDRTVFTNETGATLGAFDSLLVDTAVIDPSQSTVRLRTVQLSSPFLSIVRADDGTVNWRDILRTTASDTKVNGGGSFGWGGAVGTARLRDGTVTVRDEAVPGGYTANVTNLSGTTAGFSTGGAGTVPLSLSAQLNDQATFTVEGRTRWPNPAESSYGTLTVRDLGLPVLSPYSREWIGYRIDGGNGQIDLTTRLTDRQLRGENHIRLERFQLGEKVNNNPRISAPVKLALALLENSDRVIELDIPLDGDLDNPSFSLRRVIRKAVSNSVGAVVSSPFRFLAGVFNTSADKLSVVQFEPGTATLGSPELEGLEILSEAMVDRPKLKLEIRPYTSTADRRSLAKTRVDTWIQNAGGNPSDLIVSLVNLERVYERELSREQRLERRSQFTPDGGGADDGLDREAYASALYGDLVETVDVPEETLETLARKRARAIQDQLRELEIDPNRLFVLDPRHETGGDTPVELPLSLSG